MEIDEVTNQPSKSSVEIKCQSCDDAFETWDNLRAHKRNKHGPKTVGQASNRQEENSEQIDSGFRLPTSEPFPPDQ